jgi:hypothetical protein
MKVPNIKFHGNPCSRSRVNTRGQTDGRKAAHHFSRRLHIRRFTVSGNNKKFLDLNARCLKLCTTLTTSGSSREIFVKAADTKFVGNPSSGRRTDTYGQTVITKLNKSYFASMRTRPNRGARKVTDGTRFIPEKGIRSKKQFSTVFYRMSASIKIIPHKDTEAKRQCCFLRKKAGKGKNHQSEQR